MAEEEKKKKVAKVFRATFEDVKDDQEKLRVWLDNLIEGNGFIEPDKRRIFFRLLANATLGLGTHLPLDFALADAKRFQEFKETTHIMVSNVEDLLRFLAYCTKQPEGHSVAYYWEKARSAVFRVFPHALEFACRLSMERIPYEGPGVTERW